MSNTNRTIRVVVADDSEFVCRLLVSHLQSDPDIQVVGTAPNGLRAVQIIKELRPDAVTMDLEMPLMNGLEALEQIMHESPTPVIVISGVSRRAASVTLQALEAGAIDFILKYTPGVDTNPELLRREIISKVRSASQIRVVRSLRVQKPELQPFPIASASAIGLSEATATAREAVPFLPGGVVVIGASTGGPVALRDLLGNLPGDFSAAVLVVQHMPATFTKVLAANLNRAVPMKVKEAESIDRLEPGLVLVAPGGYHLLIGTDSRIRLTEGPEVEGHRPSIDVTMQSVTQLYGARTKGILLTGMGKDGCMGLVSIRAKGGKTFVQDAESCVVNGMPQSAIEMGVVDYVAPPQEIAKLLMATIGR
ncbi:MAG: chemotaxis response regulator protein-glutamate methylesterase [Acidobacteriota bacterium]